MIITIRAYDRLGSDFVIAVSAVDDTGGGGDGLPSFQGRAQVPREGFDLANVGDCIGLIATELFNIISDTRAVA